MALGAPRPMSNCSENSQGGADTLVCPENRFLSPLTGLDQPIRHRTPPLLRKSNGAADGATNIPALRAWIRED